VKVVPFTDNIVGLLSGASSLDSCTSTISNGISDSTTMAEFNSTVQVKVTSMSTPFITLLELLANTREVRAGATKNLDRCIEKL
jgi:hypothetical protein